MPFVSAVFTYGDIAPLLKFDDDDLTGYRIHSDTGTKTTDNDISAHADLIIQIGIIIEIELETYLKIRILFCDYLEDSAYIYT